MPLCDLLALRCWSCRSGNPNRCAKRVLLGVNGRGGCAELATVPGYAAYPLPQDVGAASGALVEPLAVCVRGIRRVRVTSGDRVAILGAGTIGLMSVLASRAAGATHVSIVARHSHLREAAAALGADGIFEDADAIDLVDMLVQSAAHLENGRWKSPFRLVLVDEFQDASAARARMCQWLVQGAHSFLFAVGDDWQSINRFAGADIAVEFTTAERMVRLLRGTGLFTVQKDGSRPFVVTVRGVSVRAGGTEFCVRSDPNELDVLVTEGRIAVERPPVGTGLVGTSGISVPAVVNAGHGLSLPWHDPAAGIQMRAVSPQAMQAALAWRTMRVEFTEVPLKEIVRLFNDVNAVRFEVAPEAADLRISGIYWLDDPEGFSRLVESSAGLRAIHQTTRRILLTQP